MDTNVATVEKTASPFRDSTRVARMTVRIRLLSGRVIQTDPQPSDTVLELKHKASVATGIDAEQMRLIFKGSIVKDEKQLEDCGVGDGSMLHLDQMFWKPNVHECFICMTECSSSFQFNACGHGGMCISCISFLAKSSAPCPLCRAKTDDGFRLQKKRTDDRGHRP